MANNGTIFNNGGELAWFGDRAENYWNGNGDILGDGTGTVRFTGTQSNTPIQINRLNNQASIEFSGNRTVNIGSISSPTGILQNSSTLNAKDGITTGKLVNHGSVTTTDLTLNGDSTNTGSITVNGVLTLNEGVFNQTSGSFTTNNAFNFFDSLSSTAPLDLHYVGLFSSEPQEIKTSLNDFFQKFVPGTLSETLSEHATFGGGKVVITGVNLTETQADFLKNAFKSKVYSFFPA